jgi:hypothetical protein
LAFVTKTLSHRRSFFGTATPLAITLEKNASVPFRVRVRGQPRERIQPSRSSAIVRQSKNHFRERVPQ